MSDSISSIKTIIMSITTILFGVTLFSGIYDLKLLINPGISQIYNYLGAKMSPNLVTLVVFDWRSFDTLGESLILVTSVLVVLLIFGRGIIKMGGD